MRVIGILGMTSTDTNPRRLAAFIQGLRDSGYVEGRNIAIEYRMAEGRLSRLADLASDLVRRQVAVIATNGGSVTALAAKAATATIPIVFTTGDDPVEIGLVDSLSRPGGNATGASVSSTELVGKRIELLCELLPRVRTIAVLLAQDPHVNQYWNEYTTKLVRAAGLNIVSIKAAIESELEGQFALAVAQGSDALLVSSAPIFMTRRAQIVALAAHHALPAIYPFRQFSEAGGLMSYGPDLSTAYLHAGRYTGRILNGASPGDLPVQLPEKFELVINLKTARSLGIQIPRLVNARVDTVIE